MCTAFDKLVMAISFSFDVNSLKIESICFDRNDNSGGIQLCTTAFAFEYSQPKSAENDLHCYLKMRRNINKINL